MRIDRIVTRVQASIHSIIGSRVMAVKVWPLRMVWSFSLFAHLLATGIDGTGTLFAARLGHHDAVEISDTPNYASSLPLLLDFPRIFL